MQALIVPIYLIIGIVQFFAILGGLEHWVGLHWIIAVPVAIFLAYIPLVGTVTGMFGAVVAWGWSWPAAVLLFAGPFSLMVVLAVISCFFEDRHSAL